MANKSTIEYVRTKLSEHEARLRRIDELNLELKELNIKIKELFDENSYYDEFNSTYKKVSINYTGLLKLGALNNEVRIKFKEKAQLIYE